MTWTIEQKLTYLLRLPWDITVEEERDGEEVYHVGRVQEIPSALATGATLQELERELWDSLEASLECYLLNNDPIPMPDNRVLPWMESTDDELDVPIIMAVTNGAPDLMRIDPTGALYGPAMQPNS
jgi:predicted RNase H-like HicB family nuclease